MMQQAMEELLQLDPLECLAQEYSAACGKELEYSKFILLTRYTHGDLPSLSDISSPLFEAEGQCLTDQFANLYRREGLSETAFIKPDCSIEIEKLMRYVNIPNHHHNFVEMVYVLCGHCNHMVLGNTYHQGPGSLTFIVSHVDHQLQADPDCLCLTTKIRSETFINLHIPNLPLLAYPVSFDCGADPVMQNLMLLMYDQQQNAGTYCQEIIQHLLQVFITYCIQNYRDTLHFLHSNTPKDRKILEIINYLYENYQSITLKSLAHHFNYSESYLSRLFRWDTGESFSTILRKFKLEQAKKLLQTTNLKLNDICDSVGYSDTTQFIRDFKKQYGSTPAKYRKESQCGVQS